MNLFSFKGTSLFVTSKDRSKRPVWLTLCLSLLVYLFIPYPQTIANTHSSNLQVTAMVQSRCVVKNGSLNFGVYDPISANSDQALQAVGSLDVRCVKETSATLQLSAGNHAAQAQGTTRAMANADGSSYLSYEIYSTAASDSVWSTSNTVSYTAPSAALASINVYGKIPANQLVSDGTYSDSVLITANF